MVDHDRLFKELITTFFIEFLDLFLPEMLEYVAPDSVTFLDKEIFVDVTEGDRYETDLLAQVQFRGRPSFFLVHIENQATAQAEFGDRMFRYFSRLYEKYRYPVYPIVVFSYDRPKTPAPTEFKIDFPDFAVLQFNYRVIQLNQLSWRDFLTQQNPVASALMAKMNIAVEDRPKVKAECLRLLVTLKLDPARTQLISGFIDTYLRLNPEEEPAFNLEVDRIDKAEKTAVVEIVTSWMERGIEQGIERGIEQGIERGIERGRREGYIYTLLRFLKGQLGDLPTYARLKIESLREQQLDTLTDRFPTLSSIDDLVDMLNELETSEGFSREQLQILDQLRGRVGAITPHQKQLLLSLSESQWQQLLSELPKWENVEALEQWTAISIANS